MTWAGLSSSPMFADIARPLKLRTPWDEIVTEPGKSK